MFVSATLPNSLKKFMIDNFDENMLDFVLAKDTHYNLANLEHRFEYIGSKNRLHMLEATIRSEKREKRNQNTKDESEQKEKDSNKSENVDNNKKTDNQKDNKESFFVVFCNTIKCVRALDFYLKSKEISCASLHGDLPISLRQEVHDNFKNQRVQVLISTDLAARGLNFDFVDCVINFDFPRTPNDYIHR